MLVSQIQAAFLSLIFKRLFDLKSDDGPKAINREYIQAVVEAGRRGELDLLFEQQIQRFALAVFEAAGANFSGTQLVSTFPSVKGFLVIETIHNLTAQTLSARLAVAQGFGTAFNGIDLDQRFADPVSGVGSPPTTWNRGNAAALAGVNLARIQTGQSRFLGWVTPLPILASAPPPAFFTVWNETAAQALSIDVYGYVIAEPS